MWTLFKFVNLIYLLLSSFIWFSFGLPRNYISIFASIAMIVCFAAGNFRAKVTPRAVGVALVTVLYSLYCTFIIDLNYGIITITSFIPAVLLFTLDKEPQEDLLDYVTKWFSIIMAVSLVFFFVHMVIDLPHFPWLPHEISGSYDSFDNYYFFLKTNMYLSENAGVYRFGGPFLEPGHQSMICCLLLFANRFRMRRQPLMWVLLVSILFSFSLAGYLTLAIGWAFISIRNIYSMLGVVTVLGGSWLFVGVIWNDGENPVNKLIFERLEYDEQKGIKGNNRTLRHTDHFYKECMKDGTAVLGVRTQKADALKIRGAGYKIFILKYGIIGTVLVGLLYLIMIPGGVNRRYAVSFFVLMALIFMQRAYPSWYSWLLPYVLGLGIMRHSSLYAPRDDEEEENEDAEAKGQKSIPEEEDSSIHASNGSHELLSLPDESRQR